MGRLFNRIARVTFTPPAGGEGRVFTSPPFSIEFDQKISVNAMTTTTLRLYNPNDDTIKITSPDISKKYLSGPRVMIDAGFDEFVGTCCTGDIIMRSIKRQGSDVLMELQIQDQTRVWANATISQTWVNQLASVILSDMCAAVGLNSKNIILGADKTIVKYSAKGTFQKYVVDLCAQTNSQYYFKNGVFYIYPKDPKKSVTVQYLAPGTGLLGIPEPCLTSGKPGIKFQTLFLYNVNAGDYVQIDSKQFPKASVRIMTGTKKFSSFGKSLCDFEGQLV